MSAHKQKPTITPQRIDWFARYHAVELAWGEFHVSLDDGNYECGAGPFHPDPVEREKIRATWPADLVDACDWFNALTPSQRRRLGRKAKARERELGIGMMPSSPCSGRMTVVSISVELGTITLGEES